MCCFNFGKKVFSFALTFIVGLSIADALQNKTVINDSSYQVNAFKDIVRQKQGNGITSIATGIGAGNLDEMSKTSKIATTGLRILSKPKANYTELARKNNTQGIVLLRVTFLADGKIGSIIPVYTLPEGLTEQAIAAARGITFEPKFVNGKAVSVTKQVQYGFSIY